MTTIKQQQQRISNKNIDHREQFLKTVRQHAQQQGWLENGTKGFRYSNGSVVSQFNLLLNNSNNQFSPYSSSFIDLLIKAFLRDLNMSLDANAFYTCTNSFGIKAVEDICEQFLFENK